MARDFETGFFEHGKELTAFNRGELKTVYRLLLEQGPVSGYDNGRPVLGTVSKALLRGEVLKSLVDALEKLRRTQALNPQEYCKFEPFEDMSNLADFTDRTWWYEALQLQDVMTSGVFGKLGKRRFEAERVTAIKERYEAWRKQLDTVLDQYAKDTQLQQFGWNDVKHPGYRKITVDGRLVDSRKPVIGLHNMVRDMQEAGTPDDEIVQSLARIAFLMSIPRPLPDIQKPVLGYDEPDWEPLLAEAREKFEEIKAAPEAEFAKMKPWNGLSYIVDWPSYQVVTGGKTEGKTGAYKVWSEETYNYEWGDRVLLKVCRWERVGKWDRVLNQKDWFDPTDEEQQLFKEQYAAYMAKEYDYRGEFDGFKGRKPETLEEFVSNRMSTIRADHAAGDPELIALWDELLPQIEWEEAAPERKRAALWREIERDEERAREREKAHREEEEMIKAMPRREREVYVANRARKRGY